MNTAIANVAPIDRLPPDCRKLVESIMNLLALYMPGMSDKITMCVGRDMEATVTFSGGPITQTVIEDTMAHLAFYKKYFPKTNEPTPYLDSPEKILDALVAAWELHETIKPEAPH